MSSGKKTFTKACRWLHHREVCQCLNIRAKLGIVLQVEVADCILECVSCERPYPIGRTDWKRRL